MNTINLLVLIQSTDVLVRSFIEQMRPTLTPAVQENDQQDDNNNNNNNETSPVEDAKLDIFLDSKNLLDASLDTNECLVYQLGGPLKDMSESLKLL